MPRKKNLSIAPPGPLRDLDDQVSALDATLQSALAQTHFEDRGDLLQAYTQETHPGIYLIEMTVSDHQATPLNQWWESYREAWEPQSVLKSFIPTSKAKRFARHTQLSEWMPLYLGKSQKMSARLEEHVNLRLDARTFALKLRARGLLEGNRFRLKVVRLPVRNYSVIAPLFERELRERVHPLVGRQ